MTTSTRNSPRFDPSAVKQSATGRWPEILSRLGGLSIDVLDGKHHPCPRCGGTDRFRLVDPTAGAIFCNQCFNHGNGDGLAALQWLRGWTFPEALTEVARYLGIAPSSNGRAKMASSAVYAELRYALAALSPHLGKPTATWTYHNAAGEPVGVIARFDTAKGKEFRPVSRNGVGWSIKGMVPPRPLYRLSEIPAAETVLVDEGEKVSDAARALGFTATTSAHGARSPKETDWSPLAGKLVPILPDHDAAGLEYARTVAGILWTLDPKPTIKIIELPGLAEGEDLVEWVQRGGTAAELQRLINEAPVVTVEDVATWQIESKTEQSADDDPGTIKMLSDRICAGEHFAQDAGGRLYHYRDGVYQSRGENFVRSQVKRLCVELGLTKKWSTRLANEVAEFIRVDSPQLWERPPLDVLNVKNGLLRPADRVLLPHDPAHLSPVQLPVAFDPAAQCPNIDCFVGQVFPADAREVAWEIVGHLAVPNTSIQKAILLLGEGGNGKSVYLRLATTFLGKGNVSGVSLHKLEADKFSVARLIGKLANICPDLPSEHLAGTSVFKAITGGDTLVAEYKFKDSFDFTPFCRLVFSANYPPRSKDPSFAFFRRWFCVPFDRTFTPDEQIPGDILDAMLTTPAELSGLLNHALDSLDRLREQRAFSEPESVQRAWEDFHATTDPLAVWLDQATIEIPDAETPKAILIATYNRHAASNGLPSIGNKRFGQSLHRLRPEVGDGQRMVNGRYQWCYVGLALAEAQT